MEINIFGAKRFGQEIITFEEVDSSSNYGLYDYIIIQNLRPDGRGNGSYDMKILNGDQSKVLWAKGWNIMQIRGGWSWGGKHAYITIIDPFEIKREFRFNYSNQDTMEEVAHNVLMKLIDITENFENSFELLLAECRTENFLKIDFQYINEKGNIKDFEENREKVLQYWSIYSQYINNPVYRKNISIDHIKLIENNAAKMLSRLINFQFIDKEQSTQ